MVRKRVIPVLLLFKRGLVKSVNFKYPTYIGDPINAVRIFNDKEVDELAVIDILASEEKRPPDFELIKEIASEAFMPVSYGGGITQIDQVQTLMKNGVEKVIINSAVQSDPELISRISRIFGSQSVAVCIDHKKNLFRKQKVFSQRGKKNTGLDPLQFAIKCEQLGAGEIILQSIERDGTFQGYDIEMLKIVSSAIEIPLVALGGAAGINDFKNAIANGASAVAAGSFFSVSR